MVLSSQGNMHLPPLHTAKSVIRLTKETAADGQSQFKIAPLHMPRNGKGTAVKGLRYLNDTVFFCLDGGDQLPRLQIHKDLLADKEIISLQNLLHILILHSFLLNVNITKMKK